MGYDFFETTIGKRETNNASFALFLITQPHRKAANVTHRQIKRILTAPEQGRVVKADTIHLQHCYVRVNRIICNFERSAEPCIPSINSDRVKISIPQSLRDRKNLSIHLLLKTNKIHTSKPDIIIKDDDVGK
uniref:Uncharacterized protein n=1 Tax=Glossina austeni TaxID=7395 RepID=A0A1A9V1Z7_GLOAU